MLSFDREDLYDVVRDSLEEANDKESFVDEFRSKLLDKLAYEFPNVETDSTVFSNYMDEYSDAIMDTLEDEDIATKSEDVVNLLIGALPEPCDFSNDSVDDYEDEDDSY